MLPAAKSQGDSSSSEDEQETNWALLKETLGPAALSALQQHMSPSLPATTSGNLQYTPSSACSTLPECNTEYGKKEYWDDRFAHESEFEWLVSYHDVKHQLGPFLTKDSSILLVGCGNSSFSADLYDAGYLHICSLDYSTVVIDAMKQRHKHERPGMEWIVMDMTHMDTLRDTSFDVVIDKAAMDALMTGEEDVWNPAQTVIDASRRMCHHISRLLKVGGHNLHISFAQPHFRKKYLLGSHPNIEGEEGVTGGNENYSDEFGWSYRVETIGGDNNRGCFHHFLYIMTKREKVLNIA